MPIRLCVSTWESYKEDIDIFSLTFSITNNMIKRLNWKFLWNLGFVQLIIHIIALISARSWKTFFLWKHTSKI